MLTCVSKTPLPEQSLPPCGWIVRFGSANLFRRTIHHPLVLVVLSD